MDGRGAGPVVTLLTQKPVDLTLLAKNNGGTFPFMQVYDTIDVREMPSAHGTREMPIWGPTGKADGEANLIPSAKQYCVAGFWK